MRIERVDVARLNPAVYNPRKDLQPSDPEYQRLKKSILEFDYVEPIVWNERSGNVVGGHQRLKILIDEGAKELDVSVVDLPDDKEKALNLALNKSAGEWDNWKLKELLEELDTGSFDMDITGFSEEDIEALMTQFHVDEVDDGPEIHDDEGINYQSQHGVIVICESEPEQERIFEKLTGEGYNCRVVSV